MGRISLRAGLGAAVVLAAALAVGCGGDATTEQPQVEVPPDAIAVVAGTPIARTEFEQLMERAKAAYEDQEREFPTTGTADYEALKHDAVELLTDRIVFAREAEALGITVTEADVTKRLDELKLEFYANEDGTVDEEKFKAELEKSRLTEQELGDQLRATLVSERLSEQLTKDLTVTDAEIQAYYDENPDRFTIPESREVAHILVETKTKADDLYRQLQDGADFAALATKNSTDPGSAENGGKLTDTRGNFVPPFEEVAFALETGEIGEPVKSDFGWHIIKALEDTTPETVTPFADVKADVREQLLRDKQAAVMADWVAEIRAKYALQTFYQVGFEPPVEATTSTDTGSTDAGTTSTGS